MVRRAWFALRLGVLINSVVACGGNDPASKNQASGGEAAAGRDNTGGSVGNGGSDGVSAGSGGTGGGTKEGRFGSAEVTFTLPVPSGELPALYHPELMSEFPDVDFDALDRLYIPAGKYRTILL